MCGIEEAGYSMMGGSSPYGMTGGYGMMGNYAGMPYGMMAGYDPALGLLLSLVSIALIVGLTVLVWMHVVKLWHESRKRK